MTVWVVPLIIVNVLLLWVTLTAIRKSSRLASLATGRDEIPEIVEEHPFKINPIIWIILIAAAFMGFVIAYYAAGGGFV